MCFCRCCCWVWSCECISTVYTSVFPVHVIPVTVLVKEVCSFPQDGGDVVFATPLSYAQAAAVDCAMSIAMWTVFRQCYSELACSSLQSVGVHCSSPLHEAKTVSLKNSYCRKLWLICLHLNSKHEGLVEFSFAVCVTLLCSSSMKFLNICFLQLMKLRSLANGFAEIPFACRAFRSVEPSCACQYFSHGS